MAAVRVLCVTADAGLAGTVQQILGQAGVPFTQDVSNDARAAAARARAGACDIVLLDDRLTDGDPTEALGALRMCGAHLGLILLLSGPNDQQAAQALLAGADDCLVRANLAALPASLARVTARAAERARPAARVLMIGDVPDPVARLQAASRIVLTAASQTADGRLVHEDGSPVDPSTVDVILVDARGRGALAAILVRRLAHEWPIPIIVLRGQPRDGYLRAGAFDCFGTAIEPDRLQASIAHAARERHIAAEQAALRGRELRMRAIVETLPERVILVAADGTVLAMNLAALRAINAPNAAAVVGRSLFSFAEDEHHESIAAVLGAIARGESAAADLVVRALDGSPRPVVIHAVPFQREPGRPPAALAVLRDPAPAFGSAVALPDSPEAALLRAELEAQIEALGHQLREEQEQRLRAEHAIGQLRAEHGESVARLEAQAREAEAALATASMQAAEINDLRQTLEMERAERARIAQRLEAAILERQKSAAEDESQAATIAALEAELETERNAHAATLARVEELAEQLASARTAIGDEADRTLAAEREARIRAEAELERLRAEHAATAERLQRRLEGLESARASAEERAATIARLEQQLADEREARQSTEQTLQLLKDAQAGQQALWEAQYQRLRQAERAAAEREAEAVENAAMRALRIAQLEEEHKALTEQLREARELARHSSQRHSDELARWTESARALQERAAVLEDQLAAAQDALARLERDTLPALQSDRARLAAEVERLRDEMDRLTSERSSALETAASFEATRLELERAAADAETRLREALAAHEQEKTARTAAEHELSEWRGRADKAAAALATVEADFNRAKARIDELTARLAEAEQAGDMAARYRCLFDFQQVGVATTLADGSLVSCNDAAAQLCGMPNAEAMAATPGPHPFFQAALATRPAGHAGDHRFEVCLQHNDGLLHWLLGVATPRQDADGTERLEWLLIDASDRHLHARRSRYLRRVDALTRFLTSATAECAGLMDQVSRALGDAAQGGRPEGPQWDEARYAIARTQSVLHQLSGFAHKRSRKPEVIDLNEALDRSSILLSRLSGDEAPCETRISSTPLHVWLDPADLEQALTTLVLAARDTLPAGGELTVVARAERIQATLGGFSVTQPTAILEIHAEGYGATEGVLSPKLDDLVARIGGTIELKHEPPNRTSFIVQLALVHTMTPPPPVPPAEPNPSSAAKVRRQDQAARSRN